MQSLNKTCQSASKCGILYQVLGNLPVFAGMLRKIQSKTTVRME